MRYLILDGYNLMHRARFGFKLGQHYVVFNFFRGLRPLVEKFKPDKIYFVLEGYPKHRSAIDTQYKANRIITEADPKYEEMKEFHRQKRICIDLIKKFPVTIVRQPDFECDDTIANLVEKHKSEETVIISSDSDFNQLLEKYKQLKIYNPVRKNFIDKSPYPYLLWKSLRGDKTDNIPGIKGCGDKTAAKLASDPALLEAWLVKDPNRRDQMIKNFNLIQLKMFDAEQWAHVEQTDYEFNKTEIKEAFTGFEFRAMLKENAWNSFVKTFESVGDWPNE